MPVIGQNDNGLVSARSTLTGRLEHSPKIVNVFGESFRRRSRSVTVRKNVPPGTKARMYCGMILV